MRRDNLLLLSLAFFCCVIIGQGCLPDDEYTMKKLSVPPLHVSIGWCDLYFADHLNTVMPESGPKKMANALVQAINRSQNSVDFAIFRMQRTPEILDALKDAVDRGVRVRGVVDSDFDGVFFYNDTQELIDTLPSKAVIDDHTQYAMENNFFIFDNNSVWTGSTNISETGIYVEYDANWSIYIRHDGLAQAYRTEFEEMYSDNFQRSKTDNTQHIFPTLPDGSIIESYFAPTDDAENNVIIRAIKEAKETIHVQTDYLGTSNIVSALVDAHNRGVKTRIIIDAVGARSPHSKHEDLRKSEIPVKVENWGGKMHMKGAAIDGDTIIIGSQSWSKAGNEIGDGNTLYIRNQHLAEAFIANFNASWHRIPNQWLTANPRPESDDSIGSRTDGIDNDYNGLVDLVDFANEDAPF